MQNIILHCLGGMLLYILLINLYHAITKNTNTVTKTEHFLKTCLYIFVDIYREVTIDPSVIDAHKIWQKRILVRSLI